MSENKFTKNLRATIVSRSNVYTTMPGDMFHLKESFVPTPELSAEQTMGKVWHVSLTFQTGFDQSSTSIILFGDNASAQEVLEKYPVGKEVSSEADRLPWDFREIFGKKSANPLGLFGAGDDDFFLCYDVLSGAGLNVNHSGCAPVVEEWHGPEKIEWFSETFGGNWGVVADLEYCLNHFSSCSMVVVACKALFNYFVQQDDYSAGYFMRELELMHGGAEQMASDALKLREKAGEGGSKASSAAKAKRLTHFMTEIEALGDLFPRISERAILDQAFSNAIEADPLIWKQGRGQQEQYETELRSDPDFRNRYFSIFSKTA